MGNEDSRAGVPAVASRRSSGRAFLVAPIGALTVKSGRVPGGAQPPVWGEAHDGTGHVVRSTSSTSIVDENLLEVEHFQREHEKQTPRLIERSSLFFGFLRPSVRRTRSRAIHVMHVATKPIGKLGSVFRCAYVLDRRVFRYLVSIPGRFSLCGDRRKSLPHAPPHVRNAVSPLRR